MIMKLAFTSPSVCSRRALRSTKRRSGSSTRYGPCTAGVVVQGGRVDVQMLSTNSTSASYAHQVGALGVHRCVLACLLSVMACAGPAQAATSPLGEGTPARYSEEGLPNVPGSLGSSAEDTKPLRRLSQYFEGDAGKQVKTCTKECVTTCTRGGSGAPGLGPITMRGEPVVFQEGYRSRKYCLRECAEVCSLKAEAQAKERDRK